MKTNIIHPIPPFYDKNSNILILGSFPSVKSREQMFFYGHPQNRFWKVISSVFGSALPETIPEKKAFLKKNRIALWDVIGSCDIEGSSDSSIENVVANDISVILKNAGIRGIFVNGKTAEKYYKKYIEPETGVKAVCLPSTSPANAAWSLDRLTKAWGEAIENMTDNVIVTKKQYEELFLEMHPGYFERDYVRAVPENEPASEMLLKLSDFDENIYVRSFRDNVTFGYYHGDIDKLKEDVKRVVPHWSEYFGKETKVFCGFVDGKVASFCIMEDFGIHTVAGKEWKIGGPGCVGTLPELRDRGIGLSMIREATKILKEEGYDYSHIHYTYEVAWYEKLGYRTFVRWTGKGFCE